MSRVFASVGVFLGLVGLLACAAAIGGVWWFSHRYLNQAVETAKAVEALLASGDARFDRLRTGVADTNRQVVTLRTAAQAIVKEGNQADPAYKARVRDLIETLDSKIERAEDVAQLLSTGAGLVSSLSDSAGAEEVKNVEKTVKLTVTTLDGVRKQLVAAKSDENLETTAKNIDRLAGSLESILTEVVKGVGEVDSLLKKSRSEVESLSRTILFWRNWGPWIVTLVLVWLGVGQFALLAWGWSHLKDRTGGSAA